MRRPQCYEVSMLCRLQRFSFGLQPILLLILAVLTPLAYGSPPDPSWINGIYDGADYDDVVILITSAVGAVSSCLLAELRPLVPPASHVVLSATALSLAPPPAPFQPRAPPAS